MGSYVRVKPDTKMWNLMDDVFTYQKKWAEHEKEIESFLGFPLKGNLYLNVHALQVNLKTVAKLKPEWLPFFKKDGTTRVKSKLHQEWLDLVQKLNLQVYDFGGHVGLSTRSGWGSVLKGEPIGDEYFLTIDPSKFDFDKDPWAEPIEEADFLRLKADFLDSENKAAIQNSPVSDEMSNP